MHLRLAQWRHSIRRRYVLPPCTCTDPAFFVPDIRDSFVMIDEPVAAWHPLAPPDCSKQMIRESVALKPVFLGNSNDERIALPATATKCCRTNATSYRAIQVVLSIATLPLRKEAQFKEPPKPTTVFHPYSPSNYEPSAFISIDCRLGLLSLVLCPEQECFILL